MVFTSNKLYPEMTIRGFNSKKKLIYENRKHILLYFSNLWVKQFQKIYLKKKKLKAVFEIESNYEKF